MISVVIPTLDVDKRLAQSLTALVPASVCGLVREVIIVDGGSRGPEASELADEAGAVFIQAPRGRGSQLAAGAAIAKGSWLLFLHADTVLETGWHEEVNSFIKRADTNQKTPTAGVFRFALDDFGAMPRLFERLVALRYTLFALPYGDQGLLIPTDLYDELGGYRPLPLMEDVDIVRRLGRRRLAMLRAKAVTSATRYKSEGYLLRGLRNLCCITLYYLRVPPRFLQRIYG